MRLQILSVVGLAFFLTGCGEDPIKGTYKREYNPSEVWDFNEHGTFTVTRPALGRQPGTWSIRDGKLGFTINGSLAGPGSNVECDYKSSGNIVTLSACAYEGRLLRQ